MFPTPCVPASLTFMIVLYKFLLNHKTLDDKNIVWMNATRICCSFLAALLEACVFGFDTIRQLEIVFDFCRFDWWWSHNLEQAFSSTQMSPPFKLIKFAHTYFSLNHLKFVKPEKKKGGMPQWWPQFHCVWMNRGHTKNRTRFAYGNESFSQRSIMNECARSRHWFRSRPSRQWMASAGTRTQRSSFEIRTLKTYNNKLQ